MKDMERQKFEDEWKDAFGKAEIDPSENVWTNIELDLEKAEGERMRRRLRTYQLMAAASVIFALCIAGFGAYYLKNYTGSSEQFAYNQHQRDNNGVDDKGVAEHETKMNSIENDGVSSAENHNASIQNHQPEDSRGSAFNRSSSSLKEDSGTFTRKNTNPNLFTSRTSKKANEHLSNTHKNTFDSDAYNHNHRIASGIDGATREMFSQASRKESIVTIDHTRLASAAGSDENKSDKDLPPYYGVPEKPDLAVLHPAGRIVLVIPKQEVDPVAQMMARLQQRELELRGEEKRGKKKNKMQAGETFWTSLAMATGGFTATNSNANSFNASVDKSSSNISALTVSNYNADASKEIAGKQSRASGVTYATGVSVGAKVSERWLVQGGVNYLAQNSTYEADAVTKQGADGFSLFTIKDATVARANNNIKPSAPYSVNNSLRFLSIPFQAGYIALKRKFGIQVNTGISTDLFLQSIATATVNDSEKKVKDGRGSDSPYRAVNFSGLLGTEFSYRIGEHYRVALNPGLRYPFSSIYKSQTGVKALPLTMDVGLKFKYFFH